MDPLEAAVPLPLPPGDHVDKSTGGGGGPAGGPLGSTVGGVVGAVVEVVVVVVVVSDAAGFADDELASEVDADSSSSAFFAAIVLNN